MAMNVQERIQDFIANGMVETGASREWKQKKQRLWNSVPHLVASATNTTDGVFTGLLAQSLKSATMGNMKKTDNILFTQKGPTWVNYAYKDTMTTKEEIKSLDRVDIPEWGSPSDFHMDEGEKYEYYGKKEFSDGKSEYGEDGGKLLRWFDEWYDNFATKIFIEELDQARDDIINAIQEIIDTLPVSN